jgi:branched-chain amino acid transport system ATP-binding protein
MAVGLRIEETVVAFGGLRAVDDVTMDFRPGEITGLIGPNGSGKSTLVNHISGQVAAKSGRVLLGDIDITKLRPDQITGRGLARTYQIPRVPPELTAGEVINVPLTYVRHHGRLIPGLADPLSIARYCGLASPIDRPCAQLSVTDLRRLEIARALACAPAVLLLDEVMAGLSHADAQQVVDLVRRIHASGVTVVIIEHVMSIIADLCQRVVVLNNGRLLASGTPQSVLTDPAVREAYLGKRFTL